MQSIMMNHPRGFRLVGESGTPRCTEITTANREAKYRCTKSVVEAVRGHSRA